MYPIHRRRWDSTVVIESSYRLGDRGVGVPSSSRVKNFLFSSVHTGGDPPNLLREWVKWLGHETDHSPPTSAKVKEKIDLYTSTAPNVLMVLCLIS
jgi:hypothetical protein